MRRADAVVNDDRILDAARAVFTEMGPSAPVSAIARRAGTGIGSLYRRYPSKEDLLRQLLVATIDDTRERAERAVLEADHWAALRDLVLGCVESLGMPTDPGPLAFTDELSDADRRARVAIQAVVERAQAAGRARQDIDTHDVVMVITELRRLRHRYPGNRPPEAMRRFDRIVVEGLRARPDSVADGPEDLGAPPLTWAQVRQTLGGVAGELEGAHPAS